jgi:hypothetical protein
VHDRPVGVETTLPPPPPAKLTPRGHVCVKTALVESGPVICSWQGLPWPAHAPSQYAKMFTGETAVSVTRVPAG